jgi:hypothetical protein
VTGSSTYGLVAHAALRGRKVGKHEAGGAHNAAVQLSAVCPRGGRALTLHGVRRRLNAMASVTLALARCCGRYASLTVAILRQAAGRWLRPRRGAGPASGV